MNQISFGQIVRERRHALGLTQAELARRVGCAAITVRKIEADDMRPSGQIARLLAEALGVPPAEQSAFVRLARLERPLTPIPVPPPALGEIGMGDLAGRAIRGYQLGKRIGKGSLAVVYRARQPSMEREVAVKLVLPRFANHPEFIRHFEAEARMIASLEHPHVVPLYDYWREPNIASLIMRYLRGGSLADRLSEEGPLDPERAGALLEQVGAALHCAHQAGIVHGDVGPANILLDEQGNAYLGDFGIATRVALAGDPAGAAEPLRAAPYAAPEQILSDPLTPQTDVYSLGLVLYELLTGRKAFTGPGPADFARQHLQSQPPALHNGSHGSFPPGLNAVIRRATAKEPGARFDDVLSLVAAYRQTLAPVAVRRPHVPLVEQFENPFKGLRPFSEADAADFWGRATLVQELLGEMGAEHDLARFLAVVGASGSGKSSVVRAGLLPALRRGGLPGSEKWFITDMVPGADPFGELEDALLRVAPHATGDLAQRLREGPPGLLEAACQMLPTDGETELLLVVDQFEELFTLVEDEVTRALFLDALVTAALAPQSRVRIVITLRADFTDRPLQYVDFGELLQRRAVFVLPLTAEELEAAITRPALRLGVGVEPELVATVVHDVGNQPGALPLLQYALTELFGRREDGRLTLEGYLASGGVSGALGRRADRIYEDLPAAGKAASRQLFLRLVRLGEAGEETRRRVLRRELEAIQLPAGDDASPDGHATLDDVIKQFGRFRLLTFDRDPATREPTVEVAHEALLSEWSRLRGWLADSREQVRLQQRLTAATADWLRARQEPGYLIQGAALAAYDGWEREGGLAPTADEAAFLDASRAARARRHEQELARQARELEAARRLAEVEQARAATEAQRAAEQERAATRLRRAALGLGAALVVAAILAVVALAAWRQSNINAGRARTNASLAATNEALAVAEREAAEAQARVARARALAAAAQSNLGSDPELSLLLALRAVKMTHEVDGTWTEAAELALRQAVQEASRLRLNLRGQVNHLAPLSFAPGGERIVGRDFDGRTKVWDASSGRELLAVDGTPAVFSADGGQLISLVETSDGAFQRTTWDAQSGDAIGVDPLLVRLERTPSVLAFDPSGERLAAGFDDGGVEIWDFRRGASHTVQAHSGRINDLAFGDGGEWFGTASSDRSARLWRMPHAEGENVAPQHLLTVSDPAEEFLKVAVGPGARMLATVTNRDTVTLWQREPAAGSAAAVATFAFTLYGTPIGQVLLSPDGTRLAAAGADRVGVWDVLSGRELFTLPGGAGRIAFAPDGDRLLAANAEALRIWDLTPAGSREKQTLAAHAGNIWDLDFSPDGQWVASAGLDGQAAIWDWEAGRRLLLLEGHQGPVQAIAFSPDGALVATGGHDGVARVWDAETGRERLALRGHGPGLYRPFFEGVMDVGFSPDGARLATAGLDGTARVWDIASGRQLLLLDDHGGPVKSVAFSPDGALLATADSDRTFHLWEAASGAPRLTVSVPAEAMFVAFGPDGGRLAASVRDGHVRVWDVQSLLQAARGDAPLASDQLGALALPAVADVPWRVSFSQDGRYVATNSPADTNVWELDGGRFVLTLPGGGTNYSIGTALSPDGRYLAASKGDGTVRIYVLAIEALIELAEARLSRGWTVEDCIEYLIDPCPSAP
ncbi:MAG: protein kinase [Candidatus Promineifilaceae bacterium]|nr:protein kinase [Candidatus Promineifilaceae bacterium]